MTNWSYLVAGMIALVLIGCGTFLSVQETTPDERQPNGVAINKRAFYKVQVTTLAEGVSATKQASKLSGIDENKMLLINAMRMPFASGTLKITVTKEQLTSEIGITSKTGVVRSVESATTILKTKAQIENN